MLHENSLFLKDCQAATASCACLAGNYALQARQAAVVKAAALYVAAAVMTSRCQVQSIHAGYKLCNNISHFSFAERVPRQCLNQPQRDKTMLLTFLCMPFTCKAPCGMSCVLFKLVRAFWGLPQARSPSVPLQHHQEPFTAAQVPCC